MASQRSLIGTSLDQVSTNAMLGTLAFQDADGAYIETIRGGVGLEGLSKDITDTAVDIFVYDTRKDSDGGAWRKRCQHTSWYNETLNTATRGGRREFPAVAVIVAEGYKLTIYDGDDPDLPMWMVFNADTTVWSSNASWLSLALESVSRRLTAVSALNSKLAVTGKYYGVVIIDFIDESHIQRGRSDINGTYALRHKTSGSIALRNDTSGQYVTNITGLIVNRFVNDVAMTVLPNAPIDPSTGLPIPTIAVATDGGVSVIRDDGQVFDVGTDGSPAAPSVSIGSDNSLHSVRSNGIIYSWNDISKISSDGIAPDVITSDLLGTILKIETK